VVGRRTPDWDEDGCLTLNVWTPRLPTDGSTLRELPVLVWFHGGAWTTGSGGWDWFDGRKLAAAGDIVVVTANHRLGPLGYLYLPEAGVENLGVQDQAAVLAWVQDNIAAFGGDPDNVTVGGQSAGAFAALYHAVAPATGSQVKQVIVESSPWGWQPQDPEQAIDHAGRFLKILGLEGSPDPLRALRAVPAEQFPTAYQRLAKDLDRPGSIMPPMFPVLGAFGLPEVWEQAVAGGGLGGKHLLTGTVRNEMSAYFTFDPRIQAITADQARSIVASQSDVGAERYDRAVAELPNATPSQVLTQVSTEILFRDGTLAMADQHAAAGNPTYVYQFDYTPTPDPAHLGAVHCCELPFLFDTFDAYPDSPMLGEPTPAARALARTFSHAAAVFTATGHPGTADEWPPYQPANPATIRHFA
jgi:para-nitrobenzyl esterase